MRSSFCQILERIVFPLVQLSTVRSVEVGPVAAAGYFQCLSPDGGLENWRYPRRGMFVYELDFRRLE